MAHWERVRVVPDFTAATRALRQGGSYLRYHPDLLSAVSSDLVPEVLEHAADVSVGLARLGGRLRANPLPVLYSAALRSESISSSWIEGIRATPRDVALAQLGDENATHNGARIVRNVAAMRDTIALLGAGRWEHEHLWHIQHELLPWQPRGYRSGQVWIGGTHALNADYAAPPATEVLRFMDDLLTYANNSGQLPVVLAAVIHAQFETIHPFEDGNGRVGRALVHGVFARAGVINGGVIPLSTAMRHDQAGYVRALTDYRYDGHARTPALNQFVDRFLTYVETATAAAEVFVDAAAALHARWRAALIGVRADAALHRALDVLIENPVVSVRFLAQQLDVTPRRTEILIQQLVTVRILVPATGKYRRSQLYQADDVLALLAFGAEAGARAGAPAGQACPEDDLPGASPSLLIRRCGEPTSKGPCQNRVLAAGQHCWRHRRPQILR